LNLNNSWINITNNTGYKSLRKFTGYTTGLETMLVYQNIGGTGYNYTYNLNLSYCDAWYNNQSGMVFNESESPYIFWHNASLNFTCPVRVNNSNFLIKFSCSRNKQYCQPVGQNNLTGVPVINFTNYYGYTLTSVTAVLNTTYTNITVMIKTNPNPAGSINASITAQTINSTGMAVGVNMPVYMWANFTNVVSGGTFQLTLGETH
jgi:hypothetical protein